MCRDQAAVDLRPAHQQALHPQDQPPQARRPGRIRRLLPPGQSPRPETYLVAREPGRPLPRLRHAELASRDKASLDIFWLKDESLADSENLPPSDVIAQEIVQDLEAALEQFRLIAGDLSER
jgi:hypothetical protein